MSFLKLSSHYTSIYKHYPLTPLEYIIFEIYVQSPGTLHCWYVTRLKVHPMPVIMIYVTKVHPSLPPPSSTTSPNWCPAFQTQTPQQKLPSHSLSILLLLLLKHPQHTLIVLYSCFLTPTQATPNPSHNLIKKGSSYLFHRSTISSSFMAPLIPFLSFTQVFCYKPIVSSSSLSSSTIPNPIPINLRSRNFPS